MIYRFVLCGGFCCSVNNASYPSYGPPTTTSSSFTQGIFIFYFPSTKTLLAWLVRVVLSHSLLILLMNLIMHMRFQILLESFYYKLLYTLYNLIFPINTFSELCPHDVVLKEAYLTCYKVAVKVQGQP